MSGIGEGFRARMNNSTAVDRGIRTPDRDAWNQPIEPPANTQRTNDNNNNVGPDGKPKPRNINDDGINDGDIDSIWKNVKAEGSEPNSGTPPVNTNTQVQKTPEEQLSEYLKSQGLDPIVVDDAMKEKIQAGDFSGLVDQLNNKIRLAHTKAISSSNQLIDNKIAAAIADIKKDNVNYVEGRASLDALHEALPFSKNPAIGPVMQTVMQRFIDKGANREQAIKGTKLWSEAFMKAMDPNYDPSSVNRNRNSNFGGSSVQGENDGTVDWLSVLGPKADR